MADEPKPPKVIDEPGADERFAKGIANALKMPPKRKLPDAAIADLEAWVKLGAPDPRVAEGPAASAGGEAWAAILASRRGWWSLQGVRAVDVPAVNDVAWSNDPVDRFLLARLEASGLAPAGLAEPRPQIRTAEDVVVSAVGRELYEKFFRGYTRKQWGLDPSELDASVTSRIPTRTNRDDRYFTDTYQAMPLHGYTRMFENMLDHPNIKILLNCDYRDVEKEIPFAEMIYTGPVDAFFDYRYGKLPYRSLEFKHQTHNMAVYQPAPVINYPNEHLYTRVTEFKYLTGQEHAKTSIVYEFPKSEGDAYYPVPRKENAAIYAEYKALADTTRDVHFVGRLATYKYYNMDQIVAQALTVYSKMHSVKRKEALVMVSGLARSGNGNGNGKARHLPSPHGQPPARQPVTQT